MSGGKGTQQTGSATKSETNPLAPYVKGAADYLTPYAQDPNRPYTAPPNPLQTAGYYDVANTGANLGGWPTARQYDAYGNLITGGGTSPAYGGYAQMAAGGSGPQQTSDRVVGNAVNAAYGYANPITGYADQAVGSGKQYSGQLGGYADQAASSGNQYGGQIAGYANQVAANNNAGLNQLMRTATESPATNPYLQDMVNAALRPVSEQYGTVTAPGLASRFSAGGRYGSGAQDVAEGSARDAFTRNLGEISTGMYGKEYEFNRNLQQQAADLYSQRYNAGLGLGMQGLASASEQARQGLGLGIQGLTAADAAMRQAYGLGIQGQQAAGNLVDQGERTALSAADLTQRGQTTGLAGLDTGFGRQLTTQEQALRDYNNFAQGQMIPALANIQAGTGLRDLDTSQLREPYDRVNAYLKAISGAGANAAGSSATQPIFGNPLTSALSGATGILGLGKELGLGSAASSLFGGGAAAAPFAGVADYGAGAAALGIPDVTAATIAAEAAPAAAAFTIVCTELVRQGRMPNTWRLAGMRQFMRYPAVARRGYWVWATPVVAHLRKRPDSRFSKIIAVIFNWRAEDLAARNGVKGARRLIRGRLVTAAMVLPCLACGLLARRDYFPSGKDAPA